MAVAKVIEKALDHFQEDDGSKTVVLQKLSEELLSSDSFCNTTVSRLVRDTLSFSKKLDNHIGAIWYFIHSYNSSLLI
jgi:hypothetical protein